MLNSPVRPVAVAGAIGIEPAEPLGLSSLRPAEPEPPRPAPTPPLFYGNPVVVSVARHGGASYVAAGHYHFARHSNSVPVTLAEFPFAMRHYPIVFAAGAPPVPVAVVGIDKDDNLFVDDRGQWEDGVYIPAYVRRYPFIFLENPAAKEFVLAIDEAADAIGEGGDDRLFIDGKPGAVIERALAFCREYQAGAIDTRAFCEAIAVESLLADKEAEFALRDGRRVRLTGFRVIDEDRFNKLSDRAFTRFRRQGWLAPIYLQLAAATNWPGLVERAARRGVADS
jgi:hypothetical protein